ncbi:phosphoribosylaminoimidazole carboxylase ATPase subunit [Salmonella enterica subsp. enterica]|nr:phosphoribosylaminoimidazole carboxylase ATPase subunit [Salmonella enterica subsp. enterica]
MKQVCVLGNGQLGRMLRQAGEPLGIAVWPVGLDAEPTAVPVQQSVITAEIERWPETALTRELARHPAFVNRDVFPIIADRLTQKQLFDKLGLATAPWQLLTSADEWSGIFDRLGELAIIKRRVGATTVAGSGVYARTKPGNCRMTAMANVLLSAVSIFPAKCR